MALPMRAQQMQRALGQRHIAVAIAFAGADVQQHAPGVDILDCQPQALAQAQAARVDRGQGGAMIGQLDFGKEQPHFLRRKHHRQLELRLRAHQLHLDRPGPAQRFFPEQFDGADGLGGGLAGDLFVALEVDEVLAELLRCDGFGRLAEVLGELAHAVPVGLLRALADRQQLEVIGVGV